MAHTHAQEIILVDDGSDARWLVSGTEEGAKFEEFIRSLPKVRLKRIERSGLMVARTQGALVATGETLTFLDSHIEVSVRVELALHYIRVVRRAISCCLLSAASLAPSQTNTRQCTRSASCLSRCRVAATALSLCLCVSPTPSLSV
jgi:hypothetical protein